MLAARVPERAPSVLALALIAIIIAAGCGQVSRSASPSSSASTSLPAASPSPDPTVTASPTAMPVATAAPTPNLSPHSVAGMSQIGAYFRNWMPNPKSKTDASGVVMYDYGGKIGIQYTPTAIAEAALCDYDRWLVDKDNTLKNSDWAAFMTQIRWLLANQLPDGRWLFHFQWGKTPVPWWSGLTDGLAISALVRAYALTGDPAQLTAITQARTTYERDQKTENGITSPVKVGSKTYYVYEEYPPGYSVGNVLNGWIFALVGLYEDETYLHDKAATTLLRGPNRGLAALKALLPYYDTGNWSRYAMQPVTPRIGTRASRGYHNLVIGQLWFVAKISGDRYFSQVARRWQGYLDKCTAARHCPPPYRS